MEAVDEVKVSVANEGKMMKSYFDVLGVCCSTEVVVIEKVLKNQNGIQSVRVVVPTRTLIVVHDESIITQSQIVKVLNLARMEANVRTRDGAFFTNKWPSPYTMVCGILLVISLFQFVYRPMRWVAIAAVAVGIYPIARKSVIALKNFVLDINVLAIIAVIGTIVLKDYLESAAIVFLFTIAEWLESRASQQATAVMSELLNMEPEKAVIAETGETVNVADVKLETVLAVKVGEVVPIDGIVVQGEAEIDEKMLTGESFPVIKQIGSTVLAGTMNLNGYIAVKTTALAEDCVVAKMAKLVEEAQTSKSRTQRFIDRCAKYYTPAVLVLSICIAVVPAALKVHNRNEWFNLALVVLVSACPCGLILSTPVATFCALSKAAKSGVLLKGGDHLETLAKVKTAAFDKTGTITTGEFVVMEFKSIRADLSMKTLLYWVSSIENKSSHPMAKAVMDYAQLHSIKPRPEAVSEFHNYPGEGIHGKLDGMDIYIGNRRIAHRAQCHTVVEIEGSATGGKTIGYIYCGGILTGWFSLSDTCRSGAVQAIHELKKMGIRTVMLTGDTHASAMQAQNQLKHAIEAVHAELLPEDKARIIKECEAPVAMVGDGVNDAPALATSDVGISMGLNGSALATETGNVILMSNDLRKVPKVIRLARRAYYKVIQNVILSLGIKGAVLALAIAGHPLVWVAVLADVGTCLLVIFNSMLLLGGINRKSNEPPKCLKDPQQVFKLPIEDIESQSANREAEFQSGFVGATHEGSKNCRKRCCAKKDNEYGTMSPEIVEVGLSLTEPATVNMEKVELSKDCRKGCCSKKNDDIGTGSIEAAENGFSIAETTRIHSQETLQEVGTPALAVSKNCVKACCSQKTDENNRVLSQVLEVSRNVVNSVSMDAHGSLEKREVLDSNKSCRKGCCSKSNNKSETELLKLDESWLRTAESARVEASDSLEKKETLAAANTKCCSKGCCGNKKDISSAEQLRLADLDSSLGEPAKVQVHERLEEKETPASSKNCTKGCCGKKNNEPQMTDTTLQIQECVEKVTVPAACRKACCGNKSGTALSTFAENGVSAVESSTMRVPVSTEEVEAPTGCKKGCCGSKKDKSDQPPKTSHPLKQFEALESLDTMELHAKNSCQSGCCKSSEEIIEKTAGCGSLNEGETTIGSSKSCKRECCANIINNQQSPTRLPSVVA